MPSHNFDLFAGIVSDLPAGAIINELDVECEMIEAGLWRSHRPLTQDAFSILRFGQFVHAAKTGHEMFSVKAIPRKHFEFYKTTIARLIHENDLPLSAADQFDRTFTVSFRCPNTVGIEVLPVT
ncbi:MAG TPA: hypothetical protein VGV18_02250 [Verrucomicrobiae bacterium]|nr:hypothetical protein [Verrucomicrobiae bacterium]